MATERSIKLRKDAQHQELVNGIKALLASQEKVVKQLRALIAQITALEEIAQVKALEEKEKRNVKPKSR